MPRHTIHLIAAAVLCFSATAIAEDKYHEPTAEQRREIAAMLDEVYADIDQENNRFLSKFIDSSGFVSRMEENWGFKTDPRPNGKSNFHFATAVAGGAIETSWSGLIGTKRPAIASITVGPKPTLAMLYTRHEDDAVSKLGGGISCGAKMAGAFTTGLMEMGLFQSLQCSLFFMQENGHRIRRGLSRRIN